MPEPYATITTVLFLIVMLLTIIGLISAFFYLNDRDIYTDGTHYYKWIEPYCLNGVQGNYWRPINKHGVFYTDNGPDFWLSIDDTFNWTNVRTNDSYPMLEQRDYFKIIMRLEEYDKSKPKEDEIEFVKELQFNYSLSRKQVFRIIEYIRSRK